MANHPNTVKCPNCAAAIDTLTAVGGVVKCRYCKQPIVLPKTTDNAAYVALETANNFLTLCNFDGAYDTYRSVADKFSDEPEAFFGMALAANNVRYINDIKNNCLQPICYNATNKSFASDTNYVKAMSLATAEQKSEYLRRANEIDYIRNEFYKLKQSGREYDCFICVKVSGEDGHKTIDSERANDIYYHLKDKGYRPFYSEREIQNETGADYEARILYALFSSPCMLVVCSNESYLQTPWVKNEYSRYISLINDEQKEANSIAIGFFDAPIERLPGRNGRLQGVCLKNPDAYSKIVDFVEKHYNLSAETPQISRKTYSQVAYQKRGVVKSQIQKRTLAKFEQTAITVSEQSKLDIAKSMLDSGNFNAVISRCNSILETNKSCALSYWYLFLAENGCKNSEEFEKSRKRINSFDRLESAIATADGKLKKECYDALFNRAITDRQLYLYDEYISLPDSEADKIKKLTAAMHSDLLNCEISDNSYVIFEAILKTVDDTDIFVDMNLSFADKIFGVDRECALKCYKAVLDIEANNGHALWQSYRINNILSTTADVTAHLIFKEHQDAVVDKVFSYGFNEYAFEQIASDFFENIMVAPQYNIVRFDFFLSLIPKEEKQLYTVYLNYIVNNLLANGQFTAASRFNDLILADDKYNDKAYFKRLYIKKETTNPFVFLCEDNLYDDLDFSAAIDTYAINNPHKINQYIEIKNLYDKIIHLCGDIKKTLITFGSLSVFGFAENFYCIICALFERLQGSSDNLYIYRAIQYFCNDKNFFITYPLLLNINQFEYAIEYYTNLNKILSDHFSYFHEYYSGISWFLSRIFDGADDLAPYVIDHRIGGHLGNVNDLLEIVDLIATKQTSAKLVHPVYYKDLDGIEKRKIDVVAGAISSYVNNYSSSGSILYLGICSVFSERSIKQHLYDKQNNIVINPEFTIANTNYVQQHITEKALLIDSVFNDCSQITQIAIPDSITEIGGATFYGCKSLSRLSVGRGVKHIGKDAFKGCKKPDIYISDISSWCNIKFENDMLRLVNSIYLGDNLITDLVVPHNVEKIIAPSFGGCKHIKSVVLENGVKQIGKLAFYECSGIESVVLPGSLISIDESAFAYCAKINNIEIPNSVTFIGDKAFSECSGLTSITIPKRFKKDRFRIFGDKRSIKNIKFTFTK